MIKKIIQLVLVLLTGLTAVSQGDVRGSRIIANQSVFIRDRWIDTVKVDSSFKDDMGRSIPTVDAVYKFSKRFSTGVFKKTNTDSVFNRDYSGDHFLFEDKDGKGFSIEDSSYKSDLNRKPYIYGTEIRALGNSWINGAFGGGTNWFSQVATYFGKSVTNYAVTGDDSRGVVQTAYQHISGAADPYIYFLDVAWVDVAGQNPYTPPYSDTVYGTNDNARSFKKTEGQYRALFANYYLSEFHLFETLGTDGGNFSTATIDSSKGKATNNGGHAMKGQGTYTFIKPANNQSLVVGYFNTDGFRQIGGIINVYVRGILFKSVDVNNSNNSGGSPFSTNAAKGLSYDAIVMNNLPQDTATITITTTVHQVILDYYGYLVPPSKTQKPIYLNNASYLSGQATPLVIWNNNMKPSIDGFNNARKLAASYFEGYPIFIVNINSVITFNDYTDPNSNAHLSGAGNDKVANMYKQNLINTYTQTGTDFFISSGVPGLTDSLNTRIIGVYRKPGTDSVFAVMYNHGLVYQYRDTIGTGGGGGSAAGSDTYVQYNTSGAFDANSDFTYDNSTKKLTVAGWSVRNNGGSSSRITAVSGQYEYFTSGTTNDHYFYSGGGSNYLHIQTITDVLFEALSGNLRMHSPVSMDKNLTIGPGSYVAGMPTQVTINYDGAGSYGTKGLKLCDQYGGGCIVLQNIAGGAKVYFTDASGNPAIWVVGSLESPLDSHTFTPGSGIWTLTARLGFPNTMTAPGTTGAQTINKPSGSVNIAAAGTTVTVTNSFCTSTSIVQVQLMTVDGTATSAVAVPGSGSFVITLNAAATAEVKIGFIVFNQ